MYPKQWRYFFLPLNRGSNMGLARIFVFASLICAAAQAAHAQLDVFPRSIELYVSAGQRVITEQETISVNGRGTPIAFTATAATDAGGNWLSVSPASGN